MGFAGLARGLAMCHMLATAAAAQQKPNIIFILVDDYGHSDIVRSLSPSLSPARSHLRLGL